MMNPFVSFFLLLFGATLLVGAGLRFLLQGLDPGRARKKPVQDFHLRPDPTAQATLSVSECAACRCLFRSGAGRWPARPDPDLCPSCADEWDRRRQGMAPRGEATQDLDLVRSGDAGGPPGLGPPPK